jgi:hypothetical protein
MSSRAVRQGGKMAVQLYIHASPASGRDAVTATLDAALTFCLPGSDANLHIRSIAAAEELVRAATQALEAMQRAHIAAQVQAILADAGIEAAHV